MLSIAFEAGRKWERMPGKDDLGTLAQRQAIIDAERARYGESIVLKRPEGLLPMLELTAEGWSPV